MKRMMVLVSVLALLMLFAVVAPVTAESPKEIPVTETKALISRSPAEEDWTTNGDIRQVRGIIYTWSVTLNVLADVPYTLTGTFVEFRHSTINLKTDMGYVHAHTVYSFSGGTFEGEALSVYTAGGTYCVSAHKVVEGTGVFQGQTLKLSYEGPVGAGVWTGFLLIP